MRFLRGLIILIVLLLIWQLIVSIFTLPPYILPGPIPVLQSWINNFSIIAHQSIPTIIETLLGLLFGTLFGCFTAILMIYLKPLRWWLLPVIIVSQAIPTFAIAPLFVIWLGYGMASKIAITILMLFFPITSAFYDGLNRTQKDWLDLAKTMNAKRLQLLIHLQIPAALPSLATGLRVAATIAPIGAVVGEWVGASKGLGFLMLNANARMQIALMFAALFTIMVLALILYYSVDKLLKILVPWQSRSN